MKRRVLVTALIFGLTLHCGVWAKGGKVEQTSDRAEQQAVTKQSARRNFLNEQVEEPVVPQSYTADLSEKHVRELKEAEKLNVKKELPKVFIWQLPDNAFVQEDEDEKIIDETNYVQEEDFVQEPMGDEQDAISLDDDEEVEISSGGALKGYINFIDPEDVITLDNFSPRSKINLTARREFSALNTSALKTKSREIPNSSFAQSVYARSGNIEYNIAPVDAASACKIGDFSFGTEYNESIDTSDLGFTTSVFTKYDRKYFSIKYAYNKNAGVSYSTIIDKFTLTPELKLGNYFSIKDTLTSDITRNRNKNELVLSVKPLKDDRLKFELGAGQTYDASRSLMKSEVKFSTQFKW